MDNKNNTNSENLFGTGPVHLKKYQHLFGPVHSRRLGRSLGVDLTPYKQCSFDCIYCELASVKTTSIKRCEFVPTAQIISELEHWIRETDQAADHITLSGSGEPTLHLHFGKVLEYISKNTSIPSVILTNGALFYDDQVRKEACFADIVKITLSSWDEDSFKKIHKPNPDLSFDKILQGQIAFRRQYSGEIWLEVFVIPGFNSTPENIKKIATLAKKINPDKIQLNSAVRHPADPSVKQAAFNNLKKLAKEFHPKASVI